MALSNVLFGLIVFAYTIYSVGYVAKEFFADLRKPFIGISSIYIYNYFVFDLISIVALCAGAFFFKTNQLDSIGIKTIFLAQLVSTYNGVLFLLKKFNFTKLSLEIKLTYFLQTLLFTAIALAITLPILNQEYKVFEINSYLQWAWVMNTDFGSFNDYIKLFNFTVRVIPIGILLGFWAYSISKKYNKNDNNYFTKSANLPILSFMCFQSIEAYKVFIEPNNDIEILIIMFLMLLYKVIFNRSVLRWLRNPDMEAIETNAILRSKKHD